MTYTVENGFVYGTETTASGGEAKICIGPEQQTRVVSDTDSATTYQWQRWDEAAAAYADDVANAAAIQGITPTNGQAIVPKPAPAAPPLTLDAIYQNQLAIMDGMADLYTKIAGGTA